MRRELGYHDDDVVHVFSGTLRDYQCFGLTVEVFRALARHQPASKLLVLTPDAARAEAQLQGFDRGIVRVVNARYPDVNNYLNAADAGFMLRDKDPMQLVASPTKFAEYCLAGLPVVMDESVRDAFETAKALGNLVLPRELPIRPDRAYDRARVAHEAQTMLGRRALSKRYQLLYDALRSRRA